MRRSINRINRIINIIYNITVKIYDNDIHSNNETHASISGLISKIEAFKNKNFSSRYYQSLAANKIAEDTKHLYLVLHRSNIQTEYSLALRKYSKILHDITLLFIDSEDTANELFSTEKENILSLEKEYSIIKKLISDQATELNQLQKQHEFQRDVLEEKIKFLDDLKNKTEDNLKAKIIYLDEKLLDLNNRLSDGASKLLAADYSSAARNEKQSADILRYITGFTITVIIIASIAFSASTINSDDIKVSSIITKIAIVLALSVAAAYTSRESSKHRNQQYFFHERALGLSTINMYLSGIDKTKQDQVKSELSKHFFSRSDNLKNIDSYPIDINNTISKIIDKIPESSNRNS